MCRHHYLKLEGETAQMWEKQHEAESMMELFMERSGLLEDIHKGSGGEETKGTTRGGKHVRDIRRAERRQDSKTWDTGSAKQLL